MEKYIWLSTNDKVDNGRNIILICVSFVSNNSSMLRKPFKTSAVDRSNNMEYYYLYHRLLFPFEMRKIFVHSFHPRNAYKTRQRIYKSIVVFCLIVFIRFIFIGGHIGCGSCSDMIFYFIVCIIVIGNMYFPLLLFMSSFVMLSFLSIFFTIIVVVSFFIADTFSWSESFSMFFNSSSKSKLFLETSVCVFH